MTFSAPPLNVHMCICTLQTLDVFLQPRLALAGLTNRTLA